MAHELHDLPPAIGELTEAIVEAVSAEQFLSFAKTARQDAIDWRRMAEEKPPHAARYLETAERRDESADWYELRARQTMNRQEAAE